MKYRYIIILLIILVAISAFFAYCMEKSPVDNLYVSVCGFGQTERISVWNSEHDGYFVFLPAYTDLESCHLIAGTEKNISVNGCNLEEKTNCSEFEIGMPYAMTYYVFGSKRNTTLTFLKSSNLPAMYIDTQSQNMDLIHASRENNEKAVTRIYLPDGMVNYSGNVKSLEGRGNSTWNEYEKKPYNIKLEQPGNLLEMGSAEKWILLANASDDSHMKNKMIYDFSRHMGMQYAPDSRWVDLYLNGCYAGLYLLCEKNEIHPERVNIGHENTCLVSQEVEERLLDNGDPYVKTQAQLALRIRETTIPSEKIQSLWQSAENAIISEDGHDHTSGKLWTDLIDLDSWARKYLCEEFFGNGDGGYCSQWFYTKDDSGVIYAGPVWDYDFSMYYATAFYVNRLYVKEGVQTPWYHALWKKPLFQSYVKEIYSEELKPIIQPLYAYGIDAYQHLINESANMDGIRWKKSPDSFAKAVTHIKTYLFDRIHFLDSVWFEEEQYYYIQIDTRAGTNIEIHTRRPGEPLAPILAEIIAENENPPRWYDGETNQAIDPSAPVEKDMSIYAVWGTRGTEKYLSILLPILLIAGMFFQLLYKDIRHWRFMTQYAKKSSDKK